MWKELTQEELAADLIRVQRTCRGPVFTEKARLRKVEAQAEALRAQQVEDPDENRASRIEDLDEEAEALRAALAGPVGEQWAERIGARIKELEPAVDDAAPEDRERVVARLAVLRGQLRQIRMNSDAGGLPLACGYDVNQLLLTQPLDGREYEGQCPDCGTKITWTAAQNRVWVDDDD